VWEDLASHVRIELEDEMRAAGQIESNGGTAASLFNESELASLPEHERLVLDKLQRDLSTQLDELIEALEGRLGSAEIFTALFELELRGRVKQMPGKNYVRCF
jgi:DNA processing protein